MMSPEERLADEMERNLWDCSPGDMGLIRRAIAALRAERPSSEELAAPAAPREREPDHCYDPEGWEATHAWQDRENLCIDLDIGGVMKVATLYDGPDKWAAHVVLTRDENGDPDETDVRWFDSEEAALRALTPSTSGGK